MPRFLLATVPLLVLPAVLAAQGGGDDLRSLSVPRVGAQLVTGVVGTPVGFIAGGKLTERVAERFGASDEQASRVALVGAYAGSALTTAVGPALLGARGPGVGRYPAAVGGAVAGGVASYLLVKLNDRTGDGPRPPCRLVCTLAATAVFVLPAVGATVGYNLSRHPVR